MRSASSGCERPANSMSRFDGPVSIQCSGLTSGLVSATSSPGSRVSSVVPLSTQIALFRDLSRREAGERFGRYILRDVRPPCNPCVVSDLDGRPEPLLNARLYVSAGRRLPFLLGRLRGGGCGGVFGGGICFPGPPGRARIL